MQLWYIFLSVGFTCFVKRNILKSYFLFLPVPPNKKNDVFTLSTLLSRTAKGVIALINFIADTVIFCWSKDFYNVISIHDTDINIFWSWSWSKGITAYFFFFEIWCYHLVLAYYSSMMKVHVFSNYHFKFSLLIIFTKFQTHHVNCNCYTVT